MNKCHQNKPKNTDTMKLFKTSVTSVHCYLSDSDGVGFKGGEAAATNIKYVLVSQFFFIFVYTYISQVCFESKF